MGSSMWYMNVFFKDAQRLENAFDSAILDNKLNPQVGAIAVTRKQQFSAC